MSNQISPLLQKEMSRKEFLATLGFGMASIMGFSTILRLLSGKSADQHLSRSFGMGYGSSPYGGGKEAK